MFVRDDLPELGSDLVSALTSLQVHDFTHFDCYLEMESIVSNGNR
jgi:hypothetical protein